MMRSESTSALGQPSETKLILRAGSGAWACLGVIKESFTALRLAAVNPAKGHIAPTTMAVVVDDEPGTEPPHPNLAVEVVGLVNRQGSITSHSEAQAVPGWHHFAFDRAGVHAAQPYTVGISCAISGLAFYQEDACFPGLHIDFSFIADPSPEPVGGGNRLLVVVGHGGSRQPAGPLECLGIDIGGAHECIPPPAHDQAVARDDIGPLGACRRLVGAAGRPPILHEMNTQLAGSDMPGHQARIRRKRRQPST